MRTLPPIPGSIGAGHLQRIKQDGESGIGASSGDTLHLLAEVERLNADNLSLRGSCKQLGAEHAGMVRTIKKHEARQRDAAVTEPGGVKLNLGLQGIQIVCAGLLPARTMYVSPDLYDLIASDGAGAQKERDDLQAKVEELNRLMAKRGVTP